MKAKFLAALIILGCFCSPYGFADDFDNDMGGPSADAVTGTSGTGAITDQGNSNGVVQGSDAIRDSSSTNNDIDNAMNNDVSRDGETMGEED